MWVEKNNALTASFRFKDFAEAFAFMTEVALHAERLQHHPNWRNVWNTVEISLNTHDAGGVITEKDWKLAALIEQVYKRYGGAEEGKI